MKDRYELEDMVVQDASGVTFRARDRETDRLVALRRFFPMDSPGSGFVEEEREGYAGTVEALKSLHHPSLCEVLDGGVDEVDGIPYLITEWADGESLASLMERGPLSAEQAVAVAGQGLEVLTLLGEVFGEGVEWLEVEPTAVVVNEETGLCRFSICPMQVLGVAKRDGGVKGLGWMVDAGMGWEGRVVPPGAAAGLGGWVAKAKAGDWSVAEAYRGIVAVRSVWTGEAVPEAAGPTLIQIPGGAPQQRRVVPAPMRTYSAPSSGGAGKVMAMIFGGVVLLGGGIWLGVAQPWATPVVAQTGPPRVERVPLKEAQAKPREMTAQEKIDQRVKETSEAMGIVVEDKEPPKPPGPVARIDPPKEDEPMEEPEPEPEPEPLKPKVFGAEDGAAMREWVGEEVVLEAVLFRVRDSSSGKTRYLEFSDEVGQDVVCGRCWPDSGMELETLKELEGKKLRFSGTAAVEPGTGRIVVHLKGMGQIEEI